MTISTLGILQYHIYKSSKLERKIYFSLGKTTNVKKQALCTFMQDKYRFGEGGEAKKTSLFLPQDIWEKAL